MSCECRLQDCHLHITQLQTKVIAELQRAEVHMQRVNCCDGHRRCHRLSSLGTVVAIGVEGTVNAGLFTDALGKFITTQALSGNKVVVGKNEVHVVQTRRHKIQPTSGLPESLQADCCIRTISCCSDVDCSSSVSLVRFASRLLLCEKSAFLKQSRIIYRFTSLQSQIRSPLLKEPSDRQRCRRSERRPESTQSLMADINVEVCDNPLVHQL